MQRVNAYGQPIGAALPEWTAVAIPDAQVLEGRYCTLERLDPRRHAAALFAAYATAPDERDWTYLSAGPFASETEYSAWAVTAAESPTQVHYAIIDHATNNPQGTLALMNIKPEHGTVEIGTVVLAPAIQQTRVATEAHYLLMHYIFGLGYRRYEWKCDSLNAPSRKAARRLGFQYEGTFRQAVVYKQRSRDTAWFAMIDQDWPTRQQAFQQWLDPQNFDRDGKQRRRLNITSE